MIYPPVTDIAWLTTNPSYLQVVYFWEERVDGVWMSFKFQSELLFSYN